MCTAWNKGTSFLRLAGVEGVAERCLLRRPPSDIHAGFHCSNIFELVPEVFLYRSFVGVLRGALS